MVTNLTGAVDLNKNMAVFALPVFFLILHFVILTSGERNPTQLTGVLKYLMPVLSLVIMAIVYYTNL
jgi:hypothetical protein